MGGTLSRKGQVTIPARVRKALGLEAGDRVVFELLDDGRVVVKAQKRPRDLEDLIGMLKPERHAADDWNEMRDKARRRQAAEDRT